MERFESMSIQIAWFFQKQYLKLFHTRETFYLSSFFSSVSLKTLASSYLKMYREPTTINVSSIFEEFKGQLWHKMAFYRFLYHAYSLELVGDP